MRAVLLRCASFVGRSRSLPSLTVNASLADTKGLVLLCWLLVFLWLSVSFIHLGICDHRVLRVATSRKLNGALPIASEYFTRPTARQPRPLPDVPQASSLGPLRTDRLPGLCGRRTTTRVECSTLDTRWNHNKGAGEATLDTKCFLPPPVVSAVRVELATRKAISLFSIVLSFASPSFQPPAIADTSAVAQHG